MKSIKKEMGIITSGKYKSILKDEKKDTSYYIVDNMMYNSFLFDFEESKILMEYYNKKSEPNNLFDSIKDFTSWKQINIHHFDRISYDEGLVSMDDLDYSIDYEVLQAMNDLSTKYNSFLYTKGPLLAFGVDGTIIVMSAMKQKEQKLF